MKLRWPTWIIVKRRQYIKSSDTLCRLHTDARSSHCSREMCVCAFFAVPLSRATSSWVVVTRSHIRCIPFIVRSVVGKRRSYVEREPRLIRNLSHVWISCSPQFRRKISIPSALVTPSDRMRVHWIFCYCRESHGERLTSNIMINFRCGFISQNCAHNARRTKKIHLCQNWLPDIRRTISILPQFWRIKTLHKHTQHRNRIKAMYDVPPLSDIYLIVDSHPAAIRLLFAHAFWHFDTPSVISSQRPEIFCALAEKTIANKWSPWSIGIRICVGYDT